MGAGELPPEPTSDSGFTVMPSESMSSLFGTPPKASPGQGDDPMSDFPGIETTNGGPPSVHQSPVPFHSNVASVANDGPTFSDTSPTRPDQPTPLMDSSSISKSPLRDSTGSFDNPLFVEGSGAADGIENTAVRETDETDADTSVSHANPLFEDERDTTAVEDVIANIEEGVFRVDSPMTTPQLIGGTPLLDLSQYSLNPKVKIMAKCEYLNPSGSIKDRIAQHIIAQAESSGQLKPGMTVVAATSGNTGAAIAMASALRGYNYIVITNKKTSKEKIDAMKAYGGEVQVSPSGVAPDHPDHYQNIENRLVAENPGTYYGVDQYNNPYNTEAYEVTLGPEIWHQTSGEVTHFIAGGSTGGTVSGTGRYLKSQNDKVRVVMADPHGSVFWDHIVNEVPADDVKVSKSWEMEGVGKDSIPGAFDINVIDGIVRGNDEDAFAMCREVAANDGLLLGGSAGLNLHAARVLSGEVEDGAVIVTVFPDNGVKYLSKIFNDSWLESKGLQGAAEGNGAVSEDVATKPPMESTVTWKAGVDPYIKPKTPEPDLETRDESLKNGVYRVDSPLVTPQLIGGTPLIDLSQYSLNPKVKIMAKCEYLNPSGSIKDRIAQHIIAQAESSGQLKPGMTVVAATSGNTGAAIAMASALRGYNYIVITNKKTSKEKIDAMKAYGGEVQVSPSGVAPDHPDHYQNIENRLVAENPGTYYGVDQYNNPYNTEAYEVTLGPEIWHQTSGEVTHFIAGGSTGGTVSGTGRYLKSQNDKVRVVMADPHGSVFWDHIVNEVPADDVKVSKSWEMEGVGKDSIPGAFDINVIDGIVRGNDEDAFAMCREVAANDGLLLGGSAGLNLHAARVLSGEVEDGAVIVTVFPDNGVKYLSKIFNDSWLESKGLQGAAEGNGAVSEDVATKPPMESTVTWKSESWNPEQPAPTAALDETHMTLETDSAPPTPIAAPTPEPEPEPVKVANDSEGLAAELRAELDGYRVAAGEMAAEISEKDEKIASLEKELKAAAAKFKAHDSKVRAEERDRVSARLDKAEGALEKERRAAEEARASQAQMQTRMTQMESSTAGTDALKARVEELEAAVAGAKAAEATAVEQAAALKGTVDDMEMKLAEAARSKAEAEAAKVEEPVPPVQTEESADADARVAAAEKVCEKLMADNQELVTRVNAQAVELDRLRGEFKDVDIAPTSQEMNGDAAPHVEEWEQRRGRGIWGFISGADRFVPPPPKEPEQTQNAQPEE